MDLQLISDDDASARAIALWLEGTVQCRRVTLADAEQAERSPIADMLHDVPLTDTAVLTRLSHVLPKVLGPLRRRIILVDRADRTQYLIAAKLGATNIIPRPAAQATLAAAIASARHRLQRLLPSWIQARFRKDFRPSSLVQNRSRQMQNPEIPVWAVSSTKNFRV